MKILITGATGLIGRELVSQCLDDGISVHYLTTSKKKLEDRPHYKGFYWDPKHDEIDVSAFEGVTAIIHLAGATVAKRWTRTYKEEIMESRTIPAQRLFNSLKNIDHSITQFISASGISIYPNSELKLYDEENTEVDDTFLAGVVVAWEAAAEQFKELGMEVSLIRTGMVLSTEGGVLPKLIGSIKLGFGAALGSGDQWQSWIHIEDVAAIYMYVLKNELEGVYNAVAPNPVTNKKLTTRIAKHLQAPLWLPNIPGFVLKLMLGEMSVLALKGQLVSAGKLEENGFIFKYSNLDSACSNLL